MWDAAFHGLVLTVQWPAGGYLLLGLAIGMYFGAVPGLSGLVGMAILLPFTFGMEPAWAFAFLMGMYSITTTSDTISSVLLGIPGTAASQATILDGYPLAQKGQASRAFGAAFTVSAVGGVLGALVLALSIPIVRPLILSFASPEFFMLGLLALTMVGALSGSSIVKGLVAAVLGLVLSMIGYSPEGAIPRYWFDTTYLIDGLPLIPFVLGLFALPELLELAVRDTSISRVPREQAKTGLLTGMIDAVRNWWLVVRCTFIGVYIGLLPGVGGSLVDWVAYGHVVQSSKDKSQFGKGDIRGVIAPETANNAMKGGSLIPTIAFAVPGSASMAILLVRFRNPGTRAGTAAPDHQARYHLQPDLGARARQHPGRRFPPRMGPPGGEAHLHPWPPDRTGNHDVRVHGRLALRERSRRLGHPDPRRHPRLRHEAERMAPAARHPGLHLGQHHGGIAAHFDAQL